MRSSFKMRFGRAALKRRPHRRANRVDTYSSAENGPYDRNRPFLAAFSAAVESVEES